MYNNYDVLDLTYTLAVSNLNHTVLFVLFFVQVVIRYFSILCLVYITIETEGEDWKWVIILVCTNTLYFLVIVKTSLKFPETQSEHILKESFNSLEQNEVTEYFQVISWGKLGTSILRGMVPPEFSCLYIQDTTAKRVQIYAMINYIYSSIEAMIYYPFFFIYTQLIYYNAVITVTDTLYYVTTASIVFAELVFLIVSLYLLLLGCQKKGLLKTNKDK